MDADARGLARKILAEEGNRGLGGVELVSGRTLEPFSRAGQDGAHNLVDKALAALADGDQDRARRYLRTGARLPNDDREEGHPLPWIVHMELFNLVTDALEAAEEGDMRWLDAALEVLEHADQTESTELRDVLATLATDHELSPVEHRGLQAAIAAMPERPILADRQVEETELVEGTLALLQLCHTYDAALASRGG